MDEEQLAAAKRRLRREAAAARAAVSGRVAAAAAAAAAAACSHLTALPSYRRAATVLWFVSLPREIETRGAIEAALAQGGRRVVVPWCDGDDLALWRIESLAELEPGTWGIGEPPAGRRRDPARQVAAAEIDLVVAPGLAFDRGGRRLGHGKGYYDRLFARSRAVRAGLCYAAQVFPEVPAGPHDATMDFVVTEEGALRVPR